MKRFIKFACVGGISFFLNLGITFGLKELWLDYRIAMAISFTICMSLNYIVNHNWAFRDSRINNRNMFNGWLKYAVVSVPLDASAYGLAIILRESALTSYYGYLIAEAIGIFVIFLVRYLLVSKIVWKVSCSKETI